MYHPTTRVLTILELLQAYGSLSGAELAKRLEVDRRTVRRYVTMLQDLGIPIEGTRGLAGGYRLRPGFKLPPLMLNDDEALAVILSLIAAKRQCIPADPHTIEGALAKIERVLPDGLRARLQAVQSSVAFHAAPTVPQPSGEIVMLISTAIHQQRRLHLQYQSRHKETERHLDPYGLVTHWDYWYLVGYCHLRQGVRMFRLDRIIKAAIEDVIFIRPEFNSLQYVLESLATTPWGWPFEIILETTLEEAQRRIAPGNVIFEQVDEGVLIRGHIEQLDWLARMLLMLGCSFIIRRPDELREALRSVASRAIAMAER
ncbi:MAG TPA: YafY family protein [Blastocatellia bacterium]|nr:YafY family protein [Blastocatellia bacterium]